MESLHSNSIKVDWSIQFSNEPKARPFKVPGPESLCPRAFNGGDTDRINFIESTGQECMTPRQACGVESAARANHDMKITIYINTVEVGPPGWDDLLRRPGRVRSCRFNQMLPEKFPNVQIVRENFTQVLEKSLFRTLIKTFLVSHWSVVQISDAIRLLLLQEHGGFYLDFDNIVFRPLYCLQNGFSYLEEHPNIENGIMVL
jgi:lactosylceramide 4-alpha-galactosyltransferase